MAKGLTLAGVEFVAVAKGTWVDKEESSIFCQPGGIEIDKIGRTWITLKRVDVDLQVPAKPDLESKYDPGRILFRLP